MIAIQRSVIVGLLVLLLATPGWSANYTGSWEFDLTLKHTSCNPTLQLAIPESFRLIIEQDGRVLTGYKDLEGVGEFYAGYTDANGFSMTMTSSCVVIPDPVCSNGVSSFSFEQNKTVKKKKGSVVWTVVERDAGNQAGCARVYTGRAWLLPNGPVK